MVAHCSFNTVTLVVIISIQNRLSVGLVRLREYFGSVLHKH